MSTDAIIYIVDDDASVRKATTRLLLAAGRRVESFRSADEFLDFPLVNAPGCVILDIQLPGRNGIEVQRELRRRGVDLPVVFMTGHGDIPISVAAIKQGAVDFLPKPVDDLMLLQTISKAIEDHTQRLKRNKAIAAFRLHLGSLTNREREVMILVIEGLLNKQIAHRLGVTESTVKVHRGRVMEKTCVESVAELVRMYERSLS